MKKPLLITLSIIGGLIVVGGSLFLYNYGPGLGVTEANAKQFIQADFIDLSKIYSISKFRSGEGRDFSGGGETCRSMKHYFTPQRDAATIQKDPSALPPAPTPDTEIVIYSPVDGTINQLAAEQHPVGRQIYISPSHARGYTIRLFHVYPDAGIHVGSKVTAGQRIGSISNLSGTDISVQTGSFASPHYLSYFTVMPDSIFAKYQARGATSRSDFIYTKEYRDAHPFKCTGNINESFAENYSSDPNAGQDFFLSGYIAPDYGQQQNQGQTNQNTNSHAINVNKMPILNYNGPQPAVNSASAEGQVNTNYGQPLPY